jgi:predicted DNA-binding helix-hairpin-helix protein
MFLREIDVHTVVPVPAAPSVSLSLENQVQSGLNLIMPLKNPAQMPALMAAITAAKPVVYQALTALHYIHFARFLPMPDGTSLLVVTSYDGDLDSYIMDFVAALGDVFTEILTYMRDASPLPVTAYPVEFVRYVQNHNVARAGVWSAYPDLTLIDILTAAGAA